MCCNGKVVARCAGNESACCDTGCYNPRWKQCKNGKIIFPQKSSIKKCLLSFFNFNFIIS
ncbi:hypothetical protein T4E_1355 [Trichinella pseudospiralis]|uniref:Uncharacterized protein n=1 Tax=Trichinella pseudospiralis TaxID=6337 RepID=A0A0V0XGJ5_TRIPS|nr:hypothetical protein T4E_1355 [Trichinella pseudospiralis]